MTTQCQVTGEPIQIEWLTDSEITEYWYQKWTRKKSTRPNIPIYININYQKFDCYA